MYYKGEHGDGCDFFSDVESSYGEYDSDSDYFEEPLINNEETKIDYSNTLDVKEPNLLDKNIVLSIESLTALITKFTDIKNVMAN